MDMFEERGARPMLLYEEKAPFEGEGWLYELKLDGSRCLAYLDSGWVDLRNRRGAALTPLFPELREIWRSVKGRCVLDGELVVLVDGKPDFERLQAREMTANAFKIELNAKAYPASYVAFDILYQEGRDLTSLPLTQRKAILGDAVTESPRIAVSRYLTAGGIALFHLTQEQGLEGIVAKRMDSPYVQGKRSRNWIKVKNLIDEDFLALGYLEKEHGMTSLVLAAEREGALSYQGHVTLGVSREMVARFHTAAAAPIPLPPGHEGAVWFAPPYPVCTVTYMERTRAGGMRQPRAKRITPGDSDLS